jgi:hypothetical protein
LCKKIKSLREAAYRQQHGRCYYCNVAMWLDCPTELGVCTPSIKASTRLRCTAEHIQARTDGGKNSRGNIVAACAHCNRTRHRRRVPLAADSFAGYVVRRLAANRWHPPWVRDRGLLE